PKVVAKVAKDQPAAYMKICPSGRDRLGRDDPRQHGKPSGQGSQIDACHGRRHHGEAMVGENIVALVEASEPKPGKRGAAYRREPSYRSGHLIELRACGA